jgi:hypothetical protein
MASYKRLKGTGDEWKGPGIGKVGDVSLVYVTCRTVVKMHCDDGLQGFISGSCSMPSFGTSGRE